MRVVRRDRKQLSEWKLQLRVLAAMRRLQRQVEAVQGLLLRMQRRVSLPRRLADVLLHRPVRNVQRLQPRQVQADLLHVHGLLMDVVDALIVATGVVAAVSAAWSP